MTIEQRKAAVGEMPWVHRYVDLHRVCQSTNGKGKSANPCSQPAEFKFLPDGTRYCWVHLWARALDTPEMSTLVNHWTAQAARLSR